MNTMNCPRCGNTVQDGASFCSKCGASLTGTSQFLIVTTPTVAGYKIKKVFGVVTGLTPRTRGILGQFIAGFQSMAGGEVTAFTSEVEKARWEAIERVKARAIALGANAYCWVRCGDFGYGWSKWNYAVFCHRNRSRNRARSWHQQRGTSIGLARLFGGIDFLH